MPAEMSQRSFEELREEVYGRLQRLIGRAQGEPGTPGAAAAAEAQAPVTGPPTPGTPQPSPPSPASTSLADSIQQSARLAYERTRGA